MFKKRYMFSAVFVFFALCSTPVFAETEFNTVYDVTYTVSEEGIADVLQKVAITNLTDDFYASEHRLNVGSQSVKDVWARDSGGFLDVSLSESSGASTIIVPFGSPVPGRGKSYNFTLGYQSNAVQKWGDLWRIDIPGVALQADTSSYELELSVPQAFGEPAFISPKPIDSKKTAKHTSFTFNHEQLQQGGVRAGFGDGQSYDFTLSYGLENPMEHKAYIDLPLPSDIEGRQKAVYESLEPAPEEIYIDSDGNYLARYLLVGKEKKPVNFQTQIYVYPNEREEILSSSADVQNIPVDIRNAYTKALPYWESESVEIKEKAQQLTAGEESVVASLHSIYEYVVAHLDYGKARLNGNFERFGAMRALEDRKNALCTEYADLFISLARAAGIPARLVEGYAHSESAANTPRVEGALHAWVEAYIPAEETDGGQWVQFDPTWGSTTGGSDYFSELDLSHVAFVRKGVSSTEPVLLANHKEDGDSWLSVSFMENDSIKKPQLTAMYNVPEAGPAMFSRRGLVKIRNESELTAFGVSLALDTPQGTLKIEDQAETELKEGKEIVDLGTMPPYSEKLVSFTVSAPKFKSTNGNLSSELKWKDFSQNTHKLASSEPFSFQPLWGYMISPYALAFVAAFALMVFWGFRVL